MVHFIQFVDQQDTRLFALQRAQKRPGAEKLLTVQLRLQGFPIDAGGLGFQLNAKPLKGLIELADGLLFVDALVALQAFDPVFAASATAYASCVFPLPAGPSSSNGFCSLAARYTVVVAIESAI